MYMRGASTIMCLEPLTEGGSEENDAAMTNLIFEYGRVATFVRSRIILLRERGEDGLATAEWVVLVALVVAMALAIGAIIATAAQDKANGIDWG
jgi:hypothetical protein